ncbi:hypothetical protein V2J09_005458 [Rumex salicifolius]
MASPKYSLIPPPIDHHHHHHHQPPPHQPFQNYVVLPSYYSPGDTRRCHISLHKFLFLLGLVLLSLSLYVIWPSDPDLKIVRLRLKHLRVHMRPHISVDVSLDTTVRISNRDAFSLDFDGLRVAIWYKGRELGHVTSREGHVRAWGSSYVDAVAEFNGVKMVHNWVHLLEDLVKGIVPFDTVSTFNGRLGFYFVQIPLKAKISCQIDVNVKNQSIAHQSCYPA